MNTYQIDESFASKDVNVKKALGVSLNYFFKVQQSFNELNLEVSEIEINHMFA